MRTQPVRQTGSMARRTEARMGRGEGLGGLQKNSLSFALGTWQCSLACAKLHGIMLVFKQTDRDNAHLWSLVRTRTRKHAAAKAPLSAIRRIAGFVRWHFFLLGSKSLFFPRGSDGRGGTY